jgi:hypothetical protein
LDYPCLLTAVMHDGKMIQDLILFGDQVKVEKRRAWRFVAGGLVFTHFVSNIGGPPKMESLFLNPDGTLRIGRLEIKDNPFLRKFCERIALAQQERSRLS